MTKPRLLMVLNEALFFTTHFRHIADRARAEGYDLHLAMPMDAPLFERLGREGFQLHPLPLRRGGQNPLDELRLLRALVRLMRELRPRLVHALTMKPVIWGGIAARLTKVPGFLASITGLGYAFTTDDPAARRLRAIILPLYRRALRHPRSIALFENADDEAFFLAQKLAREGRTARVNGAGVDPDEFTPRPEPTDAPPVILFPARLLRDKGLLELIEAARILRARGVLARFRLAGRTDPENPSAIAESDVRAWEAEGLVEWMGFCQDMPRAYAEANIVCLPSWREGLPRVLIEACASARAIVTTDVPGCRAILRPDVNGLLVPVRHAEALANALARLLQDPLLRARMGAAGRAMAETEFSQARVGADVMALYRRLLA